MRRSVSVAVALLALTFSGFAQGDTAESCVRNKVGWWREQDDKEAVALFKRLQEALEKKDRGRVAELVAYPLRVNGEYRVHNRTALLKHFDQIFDSATQTVIRKQIPECMNGNSRGFFTELGEVWIEGRRTSDADTWVYRVIAINNESWPKQKMSN